MAFLSNHPKGLTSLFFSEMWERFCYYGMRTLLALYLIKELLYGDKDAYVIYGAYTALVYAAPVIGGRIADNILGYKYAVLLGGILMAIGEFMILGGNSTWLLIGMGTIIIGNGYFKANISSIVGKLYKEGDSRRDSGFTIFYIGINIGAFLATSIVAFIGQTYGFKYGFGLAGIGMLAGIIIFSSGQKYFSHTHGVAPKEICFKKIFGPFKVIHAVILGSLAVIPLFYFLILDSTYLEFIFYALFLFVAINLIYVGAKEGKMWRDRMIALVIFMVINIIFWACFEQAGTSLTLFADRNVNRMILGWEMPASMTQFFNPFFIILFGSLFSMMWIKLSKINRNPNLPMKFALGIIQLGLGFLVTLIGKEFINESYQVPLLILVFLYMLHTTGELFLSPIGLSMVTKLAPIKITAIAMGGWFLSFALANYTAGRIAQFTGFGEDENAKKDESEERVLSYQETLNTIPLIIDEYDVKVEILQNEAARLTNSSSLVREENEYENLPNEIINFTNQIKHCFSDIHNDISPILNDTSKYKPIAWKSLLVFKSEKFYKTMANKYVDNLKVSLGGLNTFLSGINKINKGQTSYKEIKPVLGGGIKSFDDGLSEIQELLKDFSRTNNKEIVQSAHQSIIKSKKGLRTVAGHISWDLFYNVFVIIGLVTIAMGLTIAAISKYLNRLFHGVK